MATIINNPGSTTDESSGMSFIIGAVVLLIVLALFFAYALPAMRNSGRTNTGSNVNVPDKIDVNVNGSTGTGSGSGSGTPAQ